MAIIKRQETTNVDKNMEKRDLNFAFICGNPETIFFYLPPSFSKELIKGYLISNQFQYFVFEIVWRLMYSCKGKSPGDCSGDQTERLSWFVQLGFDLFAVYCQSWCLNRTFQACWSPGMTGRPAESQGEKSSNNSEMILEKKVTDWSITKTSGGPRIAAQEIPSHPYAF